MLNDPLEWEYLGSPAGLVWGSTNDTSLDWSYLGEAQTIYGQSVSYPLDYALRGEPFTQVSSDTVNSGTLDTAFMGVPFSSEFAGSGAQFAAALTCSSSTTGDLTVPNSGLGAALAAVSSASAALSTGITMAGALVGSSTLTAALVAGGLLSATLQSSASVSSDLTASITAAAALQSVAAVNAQLHTSVTMATTLQAMDTVIAAALNDILLEAFLGCDPPALSADLTTDIQLASTLSCQSAITAALETQSDIVALRCRSTILASLQTAIPLQASLVADAESTGSLTSDIRLALALHSEAALSADLVALSNAKSVNAILRGQSTITARLTTKKNSKSNFTVGSVDGCVSTLTASLHTDIRLASQIAGQSSLNAVVWPSLILPRSDMVCGSSLTAALTTDIPMSASLSAEPDMTCDVTTDITMQLVAQVDAEVIEARLLTHITMAASVSAESAMAPDLLTGILLRSQLLDSQSSFGTLRVYHRALVMKNGKLAEVPFGEEGMHTLAAIQNGYITEGATGSPLFMRLGRVIESTAEDDMIV